MVNLTIDDKQVTAPKNSTIYDAAKINGIKIPILCHDKKLKPFGACRMCLVEVEQMKGRQIPACTTPVTEGMIIRTATDDIVKARKLVLELLLLNHPLDCPVCDKAGDCDLQNLTYQYQVNGNRFSDEKFHHQIDYNNPLIERDMNRCVLCGKCARICDEIVSFGALTFIDRGIETKIGCEFERGLNCEFCGSCVSVCPVGSLLARPFKFKARFWALTNKKSICGYCGTGCNVTLGVKDGKVLTTVYDENQGFHNGQLCCRGRFGYQYINSDKRLKNNQIRKNGTLTNATFDEAVSMAAAKIAEGSVALLGGARLSNEEILLLKKVMDKAGSTQYDHAAGYTHTALTEGFAKSFGIAASSAKNTDIQKSSHLLVISSDTYETNPVAGFEINLAVKNREATITILSDKRGKLGKLPGAVNLIHNPATEIALLNAIAKSIIDQALVDENAKNIAGFEDLKKSLEAYTPEVVAGITGISAENIKAEAASFAKSEKSLIIFSTGQGYAAHNGDFASAAANIAILTGKYDKDGCGVLALSEKNNSQGAVDLGLYTKGGKGAANILADAAAGKIKTLIIAGENPLASYPDKNLVKNALDKVETLIVTELFMTDTAKEGDIIFAASSIAEKEGTYTAADSRIQHVLPAVPKVGISKSDFEIFSAILKKLGVEPPVSLSAAFAEIAATVPSYLNLTYQKLGEEGIFADVKTTPALISVAAPAVATANAKIALLVGSALYHNGTMSQYGEGPMYVSPEGYIELSRKDAQKLSINDNDIVTITADNESIKLKVKISSRLNEGVAFAPYHFPEAGLNKLWRGEEVTFISVSK